MNKHPDMIHVLAVEDNTADAAHIQKLLAEATRLGWDMPRFEVTRVSRIDAALAHLDAGEPVDVILTELDLPDSPSEATFTTLRDHVPALPIVVLTSHEDVELARTTVRAGAEDYLFKREMSGSLLAHTLIYAIERQQIHNALEQRVEARTAALKKSQRALQRERYRAERYLNIAPTIILALDRQGHITLLNEMGADILECDQDTAIGKNWFDTFLPESAQDRARAIFDQLVVGDLQPRIEYVEDLVLTGTGNEKFIRWHNTVLKNEAREVIGLLSSGEDITERKRAKESLRKSEKRFRVTIQRSPIGVGMVDSDGILIDCNNALAEILGYSHDELLGMSFADFTHPDDLEREWQLIDELWVEKTTEYRMEKRYLHKDGHVVWVNVTASLFKDDVEDAAFGFAFVQDITERKEAEKARRLNEDRMQALLELSQMREFPLEQICDFVMDQAVQLTKSEIGFLGFLDEDESEMTLHAWSEKAMRECQISDERQRFSIAEAGVWAEAVRQRRPLILNDYTAPHPGKKGCPEGHMPLTRLLSVPVSKEGHIEAIIAVANKAEDYDEADVRQIRLLAEGMLRLIHEREAREALRKSEKKFRTLVENVVDWVWQVDEEGVYTYVSPQVEEIMGYSVSEVLGKTPFHFMAPEEADRIRAIFSEIAAERERITGLENRLRARDGHEILFETNATPLFDAQGEFVGYMGTCRDITERKWAEEALRESEARYRYIFQTAGVPIWEEDFSEVKAALDALEVTDLRQYLTNHPEFVAQAAQMIKIRDVNQATLKMVGAQNKEEVRGSLDKIFVPETLNIFREELIAIAEGRTYFEGETINQTLQSERRHVLLTMAIPTGAERMDSVLISTMDITERKQMEEALQESELQKELILNSTAEMVAYYDPDLRVIWANRASAESVGRSPEDLVGLHCYEIWHQAEAPCAGCPVLKARDEKTTQQGEQQTPDGRYWSIRGYPVLDEAGDLTALVEFGQDITERKRAEDKIERYAADLQRSNEELQRFAYVVSHDLQAPLRTLMGFLSLLEPGANDAESARMRMYIDYAMGSAERMQKMIKALLNLSRVETRGAPFTLVDCEMMLQHILDDLTLTIEESDVEVSHDPLPTVQADRAQLAQVLQNLIANAIKFRREDATPYVHISAERIGDIWTFSVADNGIGLDPAQTDRIFQIFQRLHTEEEYPGLGMGLALCKRIIERHGGRIWVEAQPGVGSTFYFTLPA